MRRSCLWVIICVAVSFGLHAADEPSPLVLFTAISGQPGRAEAEEVVRLSRQAGFSQWVVYPRSGLELEYMGEDWLAFVGHFLAAAKAAGGHVWLYDEYNWPSGSCKGRVPRENPEWTYTEYAVRTNANGAFDWEIKRNDQLSMYDKYFDVNAYSTDAIRRFIELTHEVYENRFGEYFRDGTIKGIFTDEPGHPSVMKWNDPQPIVTFRWWKELEDQYRARTGRDFRSDVEASLRDSSKTEVWELYTELKGRQFRHAFFDQIAAWCRKMGIEFCGHMIGEGSPNNCCNWNGLPLNIVRGLTLPGMDKIGAELGRNNEWLTYATAQYGIERNSCPGDVLTAHGGVELYALGPLDMTPTQQAQRFWTCALYGMDTYFQSLYHLTAKGFLEKGGYGMFTSPTQPYFNHCADLHEEARLAAKWSRKRFVRDVAVRYPQRQFGRLAIGRDAPGEHHPRLNELVNAFAWRQMPFELIQDDETSPLKFVFSFQGGAIVEEKCGRTFYDSDEVLSWLYGETDGAWRVMGANGMVVDGLLVRHYPDGTGIVLNLTEREFVGLRLGRGDVFDLPACGKVFFGAEKRNMSRRPLVAPVAAAEWTVRPSRENLRRIWFASNNVVRLTVAAPIRGARWVVCDYPQGSVKVFVNDRPVDVLREASTVPYSYSGLYRESEPFTLDPGQYNLRIEGRGDDSVFLPVLWLAGEFAASEPGVIWQMPQKVHALGSLYDHGLCDYAGEVTYSAEVEAESRRLKLDTKGLVARVRMDGRDLGEKSIGPFEWLVPEDLVGKRVLLEVTIVTSIRPVFGRAPMTYGRDGLISGGRCCVEGIGLSQRLWCPTILNGENGGLVSASFVGDGVR